MTKELPNEVVGIEPLDNLMIPEHVAHLVSELKYLPVCTASDIANIEKAKKGFHPKWLPYVAKDSSGYAWQRHPRYVSEYDKTLERYVTDNPFAAIIWVDEASSIPLLKSSMKATWLRDCGETAQRAINATLFSNLQRTPELTHLKEATLNKSSEIRRALASYAQIALYTIPIEMSCGPDGIEEYLASSIAFMSAFARHRLRTGDERRERKFGKSIVTKRDSSMEERWRVDTTLSDNLGDQTLLEMLARREFSVVDPGVAEDVNLSFKLAAIAESEKNPKLAGDLRSSARLRLKEHTKLRAIGEPTAAKYAGLMASLLARRFIELKVASPARFYSIDMTPPEELIVNAMSTLDIHTLASGVCRRAVEDLKKGDPTHITASVAEGIKRFRNGSVMFIGDFEGVRYYKALPSSHKDLKAAIEESTLEFRQDVKKLHRGGTIVCFPWDVIETSEEEEAKDDPEALRRLKIIRRRYLGRVLSNIRDIDEGNAVIKYHTLSDLFGWMTPSESEHLVKRSPVFKKYLDEDPQEALVPTLIFTKTS